MRPNGAAAGRGGDLDAKTEQIRGSRSFVSHYRGVFDVSTQQPWEKTRLAGA
jgi:hypothetical protein